MKLKIKNQQQKNQLKRDYLKQTKICPPTLKLKNRVKQTIRKSATL